MESPVTSFHRLPVPVHRERSLESGRRLAPGDWRPGRQVAQETQDNQIW